jgi:hypothetical protein
MTDYDALNAAVLERVKFKMIAEAEICRRLAAQFGGRANELEDILRIQFEVDPFGTPLVERKVA